MGSFPETYTNLKTFDSSRGLEGYATITEKKWRQQQQQLNLFQTLCYKNKFMQVAKAIWGGLCKKKVDS